jgi:hypothetical protein
MLKVLIQIFVLYLLYKLIFDFIIPIYQGTKQVKRKMDDMQRQMDEQARTQQRYNNAPAQPKAGATKKSDDYIDFEEVK